MRPAVGVDYGRARVYTHAAAAEFVVGSGLIVHVLKFRARGLQNVARPACHLAENLHVVFSPSHVPASHGESVSVELVQVQIDEALFVRQHFSVGGKDQKGGIAILDGLFVRLTESGHGPRPSYRTAILVTELNAEAARVV